MAGTQDTAQEPLWPLGRKSHHSSRHGPSPPENVSHFCEDVCGAASQGGGSSVHQLRPWPSLCKIAQAWSSPSSSVRFGGVCRVVQSLPRSGGGSRTFHRKDTLGMLAVPPRPSPAPGSRESALWVWDLPLLDGAEIWITQCMAFRVWLLSLSVTCSRFIPVVTCWCFSPLCGQLAFPCVLWPHSVSLFTHGWMFGFIVSFLFMLVFLPK